MSQQEDNTKKYASIYELVNLPGKRKLLPFSESIFQLTATNSEYVTPAIKQNRNQLIQNIEKQLEIFDNTQYNFKFPESKFRDVPPGQRNQITYQQKVQVEEQDTFKDKLSEQQIEQMRQKGQFQVKSNLKNVKIPYIWKVNDRLLRGRTNIINIWENGLAFCYSLFDTGIQNIKVNIPQKLKKLTSLPKQFFTIVFGRKSLKSIYTPDYRTEVFKDFWTDIFQNELKDLKNQMGHDLLQNLYLKYEPAINEHVIWDPVMGQKKYQQQNRIRQEKVTLYYGRKGKIDSFKEQLKDVERKFSINWNKIKRRILMKVSNQLTSPQQQNNQDQKDPLKEQKTKQKDKAIIQKFHQEKYLLYTAHLRQHLPKKNISMNVIQALVQLITIFSLIQDQIRLKAQKLSEIQSKTYKQIKSKYRIRSKNYNFQNRIFHQIYDPIQKQIQAEFYQNLLTIPSISGLLNDQYKSIYKKYLNLQKNIDNLITQKKAVLECIRVPQRVFRTTFRLLPPYQRKLQNGYYYLKKQQEMTVDTSTDFWKIKLYGMRIKSWTINCAVFLLGFAWVGPFGLRCLFGRKDFIYDQNCRPDTGQIYPQKRSTVLGVFNKVREGVQKSRQYFQSLPDRGLFGKKFSRYFNYLQCYVFRLFFVGIILVLILYPIAIVVLSILSIILVFTVWLWVPLIMVICYLFNILIFQFQCSNRTRGVNITGVPLISLAWRIVSTLLECVYYIVYLVLIAPITSGIYSLFLIIQRGFRTFTDQIMLFLIKKLGRTPSRDTAIAKKISGPTMARSHFYSINQQDVYVLVQSKLQQIHVNKFVQLTNAQIQSHLKKFNQIIKFVLEPFGYYNASFRHNKDLLNRNVNQLLSYFNTRTHNYMARYPNNPYNIRFTAEQIDLYFQNSVKIVQNFVQKQKIKEWIFDQYSVLYEDYEELTRSLWIAIFNCGEQIFEPLQRLQGRFKIHQQNPESNNNLMRQHVDSVMKALEGEVNLSHRQISFNPFKGSLLDKDRPFNFIETICNVHYYNSQLRLQLNLTDPQYLMVPPRNLQQLKVWNEYQRVNVKKNHQTLFEEVDID